MGSFELHIQQRNTVAHLEADGEMVTLSRNSTPTPDEAGGFTPGGPGSLAPQVFVMETSTRQLPVRRTVDGLEVNPEYVLTGLWDADIQPGDWFFKDGAKYEVVFVHLDRSYMTTAEVIYRG